VTDIVDIVADIVAIVADWTARHGQPFGVDLTARPAAATTKGCADVTTLDVVEFARTVARRRPGSGVLQILVPF
jgi:hypothetical protein